MKTELKTVEMEIKNIFKRERSEEIDHTQQPVGFQVKGEQ